MSSKEYALKANESVVASLITDQASGIRQGVREAVQNSIDGGATKVRINTNERYTTIIDDGEGLDLNSDIDELVVFGESSKRNDDNTIGRFGFGKGQYIGLGTTKISSGQHSLVFDFSDADFETLEIPNKPARLYEISEEHAFDGVCVTIYHDGDKVPSESDKKWDEYIESIEKRFKFTELIHDVEIVLNGKTISDYKPKETLQENNSTICNETETAYIALEKDRNGSIDVYSNGIYVKSLSDYGFEGTIVTKENLSLDISRNEIQDDCDIWETVEDQLNETVVEFATSTDGKINDSIRKVCTELITQEYKNDLKSVDLFKTISGNYVSYETLRKNEFSIAKDSNIIADKLSERGETVLDKYNETVEVVRSRKLKDVQDNIRSIESAKSDYDRVFEGYTEYKDIELSSWERIRLGIARKLIEKIGKGSKFDVFWGEDSSARAWTNGKDKIVITEKIFSSSTKSAWLSELYQTMIHELCHDESSKGSPTHNLSFKREFYNKMNKHRSDFVELAEEIEENGLRHYDFDESDHTQQNIRTVRSDLRDLQENDEFYKNRDQRCSTIIEKWGDNIIFQGPKGGMWSIDLYKDGIPIARNSDTENTQEITHISKK